MMRFNERAILRLILMAVAVLIASQVYALSAHANGVEGFRRMGYPRNPVKRAAAEARVLEVYDAIDQATDDPQLRQELRRRCKSESWCNWYGRTGIHDGDASLARKRWRRAANRGLLDPDSCEEHQRGETRDEWEWWSTVGPLGNVSAYVIRHAGECVHPRAMEDPYVAARLAVAHMEVLCRRQRACTCEGRAKWWAGPGRWVKRTHLHRLRSITSYCGPVPEYRWPLAVGLDVWAELQRWASVAWDAVEEPAA